MPTIPPGLIAIKDLIDRLPQEREALLAYEIRKHEREKLLYGSTRQLMALHIWSDLKTIAALLLSVFSFVWIVGVIAQFARWLQTAGKYTLPLPPPLPQNYQIDFSPLVPTSTTMAYAARLPAWDWRDALVIALFIAGAVLIEKLVTGFFTWRDARRLNDARKELEEELKVLREWSQK